MIEPLSAMLRATWNTARTNPPDVPDPALAGAYVATRTWGEPLVWHQRGRVNLGIWAWFARERARGRAEGSASGATPWVSRATDAATSTSSSAWTGASAA